MCAGCGARLCSRVFFGEPCNVASQEQSALDSLVNENAPSFFWDPIKTGWVLCRKGSGNYERITHCTAGPYLG